MKHLLKIGHYLSLAYHDGIFRLFFCLLIAKLILFGYLTDTGSDSFLPAFGSILILLSTALLVKSERRRFVLMCLVDGVASALFLVHSLYYEFFSDFASVYFLEQAIQCNCVMDTMLDKGAISFSFIMDLPFLPFLYRWAGRRKKGTAAARGITAILLIGLGLFCNVNVLIYELKFPGSLSKSIYHRHVLTSHVGIFNYQLYDLYVNFQASAARAGAKASDFGSVRSWLEARRGKSPDNELTGTGRGMNLLVIQVESLQHFVIGKKYAGREITPNLNRLAKEGILSTNIYDQTGNGSTSDAEFLVNCSLFPSRKGAVAFLFPENSYDSLPQVLYARGYSTAIMHGHDKNYWNRELFTRSMGFRQRFFEGDYLKDEVLGLGLSDRSFFRQSVAKLQGLPSPFYALLITLTSHAPFSYVRDEDDPFPVPGLADERIGHYLKSMHYVDGAIGSFLRDLEKNGLLATTLIVIYGDHRARLERDELQRIGIADMSEERKVPVILKFPGRGQGERRETIGGLIDMAPTLCNILGIDVNDKLFLGNDLAGNAKGYVIFRNGTFIGSGVGVDRKYVDGLLEMSDTIIEKDARAFLGSSRR